jgi:membrane protein
MTLGQLKTALVRTYQDVQTNHTFAMAAGLSYYFVMALFQLLISAAAVLTYLPIPNLFDQIVAVLGRVMPAQSMGLVQKIISDVVTPRKTALIGIAGHGRASGTS